MPEQCVEVFATNSHLTNEAELWQVDSLFVAVFMASAFLLLCTQHADFHG